MARSNTKTAGCFKAAMGLSNSEARILGTKADEYNTGDITADYVSAVNDVIAEKTTPAASACCAPGCCAGDSAMKETKEPTDAIRETVAEILGLAPEFGIGEPGEGRLQAVDAFDDLALFLDDAVVATAHDHLDQLA